eukprot:6045770-Alexandrium_andersonii.AAC.1
MAGGGRHKPALASMGRADRTMTATQEGHDAHRGRGASQSTFQQSPPASRSVHHVPAPPSAVHPEAGGSPPLLP